MLTDGSFICSEFYAFCAPMGMGSFTIAPEGFTYLNQRCFRPRLPQQFDK